MHRHGYKGRKFHRETDQRKALIKGLADSLIKYEKIETTLPKAKEVVPYVEKLITKAKKGDLASRRRIIASLQTIASAHKLVDELAPKMVGRDSGHLRVSRTNVRRGDNAQLAVVSFVDDLSVLPKSKPEANDAKPATKSKSPQTKPGKNSSTVASKKNQAAASESKDKPAKANKKPEAAK